MTTLIMLMLTMAHANTLRIDGNGVETTFACTPGQDVTVEGNQLSITLTGDCGTVKAVGNTNTITVDGVARVEIQGTSNTVKWARNLSSSSKLPTSKIGAGNKVKGIK